MRSSILLSSLSGLVVSAFPLGKRAADNTQAVGINPISQYTVEFLGAQTSNNSCSHRDLGFTGSIAGTWYAVYGDTLWCSEGVTDPLDDATGFHGMVRNSVSLLTDEVTTVHDLHLNSDSPVPHQQQFVPYNASWGETNTYGFGGTSLVEVNPFTAEGAVFYLVNAGSAGLKGAGVGKVQVINGVPTLVERLDSTGQGYWWDATTNARYGDVAAFRDPNSDYIYAWGGAPTTATDYVSSRYVYQVRVNASQAYDFTQYEYWYGRDVGWKQNIPLQNFNAETAVMWNVGQGQVVWSPFYNSYIFVHLVDNEVALRTASSPEGPWTADTIVYTVQCLSGGLAYAGVAHPYLDSTGQTLTISFTNDPNTIQAIKVTFSK